MLRELFITKEEKIPKGWKTCRQWSEDEGLSMNQTGVYLRKGVERGLMEMQKFAIKHGNMIRKVPHYRIKA